MKPTKAIACTAAVLLMPALARAAPAPSHDHHASGQSQPTQGEATKPQEMKCPMMQGEMKMDGQAMPHGRGSAQHSATGGGTSPGTAGMKCMHHETAATIAPAPAPEEQHDHDHPVVRKSQ